MKLINKLFKYMSDHITTAYNAHQNTLSFYRYFFDFLFAHGHVLFADISHYVTIANVSNDFISFIYDGKPADPMITEFFTLYT
ncbi:hypothetical protein [Paenibacillus psychroresistens]